MADVLLHTYKDESAGKAETAPLTAECGTAIMAISICSAVLRSFLHSSESSASASASVTPCEEREDNSQKMSSSPPLVYCALPRLEYDAQA